MAIKQTDRPAPTPAAKMLERLQLELRDTLERLCLVDGADKVVEVVSFGSRNDDLRVLFRVHDEARWLPVLAAYLTAEDGAAWYSHWGKRYLVREGRLLYGWVVQLASDNLDETVQAVRKMLTDADHEVFAAKRRTDIEIPLPSDLGYSPEQQARVKPTTDSRRLR